MTDVRQVEARERRSVLIVDDSRTIRSLLRTTISADPRLTVVGEAGDPYEARGMIRELSPDVITLDVEMPRMNGLDFLERLMRLRPMPVVMVSTRTKERSEDAIRALSIGAVDCVDVARLQADPAQGRRLSDALYCAAGAMVGPRAAQTGARAAGAYSQEPFRWNGRIVLVGSSTGGVDAVERVLSSFPVDCPPTVIAQHMPEAFLRSFASRLNETMRPNVRLARDGDALLQGTILLAPGGLAHAALSRMSDPKVVLVPAREDDLYVPAVDILFGSAVPSAPRIIAAVLTGMGRDGAQHLPALSAGGAVTLAQSGESCVVDGMPRAARETGSVSEVVALDAMGPAILDRCKQSRAGQTPRRPAEDVQ